MRRTHLVVFSLVFAVTSLAQTASKGIFRTKPGTAGISSGSAEDDLLFLRDGTNRRGHLKNCVSDRCQLDNAGISRSDIAWIAFSPGRDSVVPPAAKQAESDEVHLRDFSVHIGRLVGLNPAIVALETGSFDRKAVAWIHLASKSSASKKSPTPQAGTEKATEGGTESIPGQPPMTPSTSPPSASSGPRSVLGALWLGTISYRFSLTGKDYTNEIDLKVQARLREYPHPLLKHDPKSHSPQQIGSFIELEPEGTILEERHSVRSKDLSCMGEGSTTLTVAPDDDDPAGPGHPSCIFLKSVDEDTRASVGFDIPRQGGLYAIGLSTGVRGPNITLTCSSPDGMSTEQQSFRTVVIGRSPTETNSQPGGDPELRSLTNHDGRMSGSYTAHPSSEPDSVIQEEVSWNICREGVDCSAPSSQSPGQPPIIDPCGGTAQQDGLSQTCRAQRQQMQDSLAKQWKRYLEEVNAAQEHLGDYRKTVAACAAWDITIKVLEYLVGGGFPAAAEGMSAETVAAIREYQEALKVLAEFTEKMINGEDPLVVPDSENDVALENLNTLQEAFENISRLAGMLGAASPEAMEEHLKDCGAPVRYATYHSAEQYVEHLKGFLGMAPGIHRLVNEIRGKDLECLNRQFDAYRACVQYARCRGTAESACDGKKPPGDWPAIP